MNPKKMTLFLMLLLSITILDLVGVGSARGQSTVTPTPVPTNTPLASETATPELLPVAIVISDSAVNVRSGAGVSFDIVSVAQPGDVYVTIGEENAPDDILWYNIQLPDGNNGWIAAFLVEVEQRTASDTVMNLLLSATQNLTNGDYESALAEFNAVLKLDPENWAAYYGIGDVYYHFMEDCDKASEAYRNALALEPTASQINDPAALLAYEKIANCFGEAGEFEQVVAVISEAEQAGLPLGTMLYYYRGSAHLLLGDQEAASIDFLEVLRLDPVEFATELYSIGFQAYLSGTPDDLDNGLFHLNVLIAGTDILSAESEEAAADVSEALLLRGIILDGLGDTEAAAADYIAYISAVRPETADEEISLPATSYTVEMHEGKAYYLSFEAEAGEIINISALGIPNGEVDPLIVLLSPDGLALVGNDDSADDAPNARIQDFELPVDGVYVLIVTHAGGGSEGSISLEIQIDT